MEVLLRYVCIMFLTSELLNLLNKLKLQFNVSLGFNKQALYLQGLTFFNPCLWIIEP